MRINEAAELLANKTHCIYDDCWNFSLLKKTLKIAFPEDLVTDKFEFDKEDNYYGFSSHEKGNWGNIGGYLEDLTIIKLSEITDDKKEKVTMVLKKTQNHYDNSKGSLYQFCEDKQLNSYEFDIIKRIMRCRKKGQFKEDLEKTKFLIDLYLTETNH